MRTTAIICECNPFHYGHQHIFARAKKDADCVIAIMSGNFVQRAEAAVFDKYARAEVLVRCGVDLVVELPFPWCSASAEYFASAGVALANAVQANTLTFGANREDSEIYQQMADVLQSDEYREYVIHAAKGELRQLGAAQIRERFLQMHFGHAAGDIMRLPNDILAVEYCKAAGKCTKDICIKPVLRISEKEKAEFRGATKIREIIRSGAMEDARPYLPSCSYEVFQREWDTGRYALNEKLAYLAFAKLRMTGTSREEPAEGADGVIDRLIHCAGNSANAEEMYTQTATKKYTNTRFRRAALYHLLRVKQEFLREEPLFTVLLAASMQGCKYLATIRKTAEIPILTKPSDFQSLDEAAEAQYRRLCEADRLYTMCLRNVQPANHYLKRSPYIAKEKQT